MPLIVEMSKNQKLDQLITKINHYAQLAKKRELTTSEKKDREFLRQEYIEYYKQNLKQSLSQIKVVDEKGNDLTSDKIKLLKKELRKKNEK